MIIAILIGVAAGAAVFGGLVLVWHAAGRRSASPEPDISTSNIRIEDIWQTWQRGGLAPAAAFADESPAQSPNKAALAHVHDSLLKTEKAILAQSRPLTALRREIMDGIDRRVLQQEVLALPPESRDETIGPVGNDSELRQGLAVDALRIRLLRYYGAAKFGDRAENDWYDVYQQAAQMKRRGFRDFLARHNADAGQDRYSSVVVVGERLRRRLLEIPPGTSFADPARRSERTHS